jgi:proline iminopeptidase
MAREEKGNTFQTRGATLYYEVIGRGDATPLVLVNGGPGFDHDYLHLSPVWNELAKTRRVVFYDQRGNGRSKTAPDAAFGLAAQIEDLEALREHLGLERMNLLGHSWGGFLAMAYAARYPQHVERLILVDSGPPHISENIELFKDVFPETTEARNEELFAETLGDNQAAQTEIHEYLTMLFYSPEKRNAFLAGLPPDAYNPRVSQAASDDASRFDLTYELGKFRFPVLIAHGRFDFNVAPSVAFKMHDLIRDSKIVIFEKSGHVPFYEEPESFLKTLQDFLAR